MPFPTPDQISVAVRSKILPKPAYGTHPKDIPHTCGRAGVETTLREINTLRRRLYEELRERYIGDCVAPPHGPRP